MNNNEFNQEYSPNKEISNENENINQEKYENNKNNENDGKDENNQNIRNDENKENQKNNVSEILINNNDNQEKKNIKIRIIYMWIIVLFVNFISFPAVFIEIIIRIIYDYQLKIDVFAENAIYIILLLFLFINIIFHKKIILRCSCIMNCIIFILILVLIIIDIYDIYHYFNYYNDFLDVKEGFIFYAIHFKIISTIFTFCFDICFIIFICVLIKVSKTINLSHIKII